MIDRLGELNWEEPRWYFWSILIKDWIKIIDGRSNGLGSPHVYLSPHVLVERPAFSGLNIVDGQKQHIYEGRYRLKFDGFTTGTCTFTLIYVCQSRTIYYVQQRSCGIGLGFTKFHRLYHLSCSRRWPIYKDSSLGQKWWITWRIRSYSVNWRYSHKNVNAWILLRCVESPSSQTLIILVHDHLCDVSRTMCRRVKGGDSPPKSKGGGSRRAVERHIWCWPTLGSFRRKIQTTPSHSQWSSQTRDPFQTPDSLNRPRTMIRPVWTFLFNLSYRTRTDSALLQAN